jgi:hypothetical protein
MVLEVQFEIIEKQIILGELQIYLPRMDLISLSVLPNPFQIIQNIIPSPSLY